MRLKADFTRSPLERFGRKENVASGVVYYEANFTSKLRLEGMSIIGEVWWYDQLIDTKRIDNIDKISSV